MPLSLFGYDPKSRIEDNIGLESSHAHTFGGQPHEFNLSCTNSPRPLHLIYRLNLRDPLVPLQLPNIDFLPLLYCFNYGSECCYKIVSNTEVKLIHPREQEHYFPPWNAPESFPRQSTSFSAKPFDPTSSDDVMDWKGVFGWDDLTLEGRTYALELARERTTLNSNDGPDDWTYEDVIRNMYDPPFAQSKPHNSCENPDCQNEGLQVIAIQDNAISSELIWPDELVQTIWEMCQSYYCITVTNQCT